MTEAFSKSDRKTWYLSQANAARNLAGTSAGRPFAQIWFELAVSWEFLAGLIDEPCFCGQDSIGYKMFCDGSRQPACTKHLTELVVENVLRQAFDKKLQ